MADTKTREKEWMRERVTIGFGFTSGGLDEKVARVFFLKSIV